MLRKLRLRQNSGFLKKKRVEEYITFSLGSSHYIKYHLNVNESQ